MNREKRHALLSRLQVENPQPTTELNFDSPFELLIAVMLSAQATDVSVNKATGPLFAKANTPAAIHALGLAKVKDHIKTIGLFNTKAANVIKTCKILMDEYDSQVPEDRALLEALPGVGRKTANVVLNTAFGHPTIAVDTHIFRVANRTSLAAGKSPGEIENVLNRITPSKYKKNAHNWLLLHGRHVCKSRNPNCLDCHVSDLCTWREKVKS